MRWMTFLLASTLFVARPAVGVEPITPEQFATLHALIKPTSQEEKWSQIPWMESLWQARKKAAAEGKPILLWEMDGHPLGCV
jgi:hypothetical protein